MHHSKNSSSICETTTLLSLSNVSANSSEHPSFTNAHQHHLTHKLEELTLILHTTIAETTLLHKRHTQLQAILAQRTATLHSMLAQSHPPEEDSSQDELGETCREAKGWVHSRPQDSCGRTVKNHQKFYSAIQSPSVDYSPERNYDQFTLHSYQKPRHCPQNSNLSSKSGLIRKQRDQLYSRPPSYASPRQRDF